MKVKELFPLVSDYTEMQIGNCRTGRPITNKSCLAFSNGELEQYGDTDICEIWVKTDKCGSPYLKIMIETNKR